MKNALPAFKSVPVYAEKLQNICNLIQSEGGRYELDAHDVRTVVKQFDLGPDEIRGLSSRIFYNLRSDNFIYLFILRNAFSIQTAQKIFTMQTDTKDFFTYR